MRWSPCWPIHSVLVMLLPAGRMVLVTTLHGMLSTESSGRREAFARAAWQGGAPTAPERRRPGLLPQPLLEIPVALASAVVRSFCFSLTIPGERSVVPLSRRTTLLRHLVPPPIQVTR